jgi:hypothetical protein
VARETEKERIDREVIELLNELRVTLPGVQVLFAFLLVVPFQQGFGALSDLQRGVYLFALLATTVSTILLMTPASYHRLRFRAGDKLRMLFISNRLVIAGMACLALAITASVYLIAELMLGAVGGAVVAVVSLLFFAIFWYAVPLSGKPGNDPPDE